MTRSALLSARVAGGDSGCPSKPRWMTFRPEVARTAGRERGIGDRQTFPPATEILLSGTGRSGAAKRHSPTCEVRISRSPCRRPFSCPSSSERSGSPAVSAVPNRRRRGASELEAFDYSITSSARSRTACGIVIPSAFAVLRLNGSSNPTLSGGSPPMTGVWGFGLHSIRHPTCGRRRPAGVQFPHCERRRRCGIFCEPPSCSSRTHS